MNEQEQKTPLTRKALARLTAPTPPVTLTPNEARILHDILTTRSARRAYELDAARYGERYDTEVFVDELVKIVVKLGASVAIPDKRVEEFIHHLRNYSNPTVEEIREVYERHFTTPTQ